MELELVFQSLEMTSGNHQVTNQPPQILAQLPQLNLLKVSLSTDHHYKTHR